MNLPASPLRNNIRIPVARKVAADESVGSGRSAKRLAPYWISTAAASRCAYRLRVQWRDHPTPAAPGGRWEQILVFNNPRNCLGLLRRIQETPDRVIEGIQVEAIARPKWEAVPVEYLVWRAAQREKRDAEKPKSEGGAR
jgi:hypothetical protein